MVAFQAMTTADQAGVGTNQNIVFEKVIINIGNGYYPHLGKLHRSQERHLPNIDHRLPYAPRYVLQRSYRTPG